MRPFIDDPVRLILRDCPLFMETGLVPFAPHQRPGVLVLVEDVQHRGRCPVVLFGGFGEPSAPRIFLSEVCAGSKDTLSVQSAGDGGTAHTLQSHIEDAPYHCRRVPVYHQLVPDRGIPRCKAAGYLTLAAFAKYSCKHGTWLIARGNKDVRIWITHFDSNYSMAQILDGYVPEGEELMKQENGLIYKLELHETENGTWCIFYCYPPEAEEGWGREIPVITDTFSITAP